MAVGVGSQFLAPVERALRPEVFVGEGVPAGTIVTGTVLARAEGKARSWTVRITPGEFQVTLSTFFLSDIIRAHPVLAPAAGAPAAAAAGGGAGGGAFGGGADWAPDEAPDSESDSENENDARIACIAL